MPSNGCVGSLPEDWAALATGLTTLALNRNSLAGSIPDGIAGLKAVTTLILRENKFTGVAPGLPFAQYTTYCSLQFGAPPANSFACPLPPNATLCKQGPPTC
jgi:hypothetical protein